MLNHLIIVYGGRCSSNLPWMFNSVSNEWSLLISAKEQNINDVPSPRWGHGCAILPTPGKDSPHALSLYVFGGVSIDSVCEVLSFFIDCISTHALKGLEFRRSVEPGFGTCSVVES